MSARRLALSSLLALLGACSGTLEGPPTTRTDGGVDAGPMATDAAVPPDAALPPDATPVDSGVPTPDATPSDGAPVDAGPPDAPPSRDATPPAMDAVPPPGPETVLMDPLAGSSLGAVEGGSFEARGWRAGTRITWDLGRTITHGRLVVYVTDFDPGVQSIADKHHIVSLYGGDEGNHHREDALGSGWMNARVGFGYGSGFKFLSTPEGFAGRLENRLIRDAVWDRARRHRMTMLWDATSVTYMLDDTVLVRHDHGRPTPVRYLFLGADHTYPAMPGPIYSDVEVVDLSPGR